jgi:hypothetical protein
LWLSLCLGKRQLRMIQTFAILFCLELNSASISGAEQLLKPLAVRFSILTI